MKNYLLKGYLLLILSGEAPIAVVAQQTLKGKVTDGIHEIFLCMLN